MESNHQTKAFACLPLTVWVPRHQEKRTVGYQWPQIYAGAGSAGCSTCYGQDYFGTANSPNCKDPYTTIGSDFGGARSGQVSARLDF